jgi:Uma2 family endonuclease
MNQSNPARTERLYTVGEYLAFERSSAEKHEYIDGQIIAMAGASRRHNLIGVNVSSEIRFQLKGKPCETYANDMRLRMRKGHYGYPDVIVVCGDPQFEDEEFDILLNPTVVVEILSKSTRFRDKTEKLETYQKIESVTDCLLIEQDQLRVEHYIKQTRNQWLLKIYENPADVVNLEAVGCRLALSDIYAQIQFPAQEAKE